MTPNTDAKKEPQQRPAWTTAWLDPEIAAALASARAEAPARLDFNDLPAARARSAALWAEQERKEGVAIEDLLIDGRAGAPDLRLRLYRPHDAPAVLPCLYWVHGGGLVLGNLDLDDRLLSTWSLLLRCAAVSVDYRLAPENPHPAPVEDCYAGLVWTTEQAHALGIDASRVVLGGASAGGGLAAATALLSRDRGGPKAALQLLIYPMLDDRNVTPSSHENLPAGVWDRSSNISAWRAFLGESFGTDEVSPYAAPARATDLSDLPPAYIDVGTADLFRDEIIDYAQRLMQAGVPTALHVYPGAYHGWELAAPRAPITLAARTLRVDALRRALHGAAGPDRG